MVCNKPWTLSDIPSQTGKIALVTGATGGLGLETAIALAGAGAKVLLGGRNAAKGDDAVKKVKETHPSADATFVTIDHCSLDSVSKFAKEYNENGEPIDILVCNAGIMAPPLKETTSDGFEMQLGTNHLSHFALVGQLLPSLRKSQAPRVVNVSSIAARTGKINFDDLNWEKSYSQWGAYDQSKLANLVFTFEMQRRSDENGWGISCIGAHPGISKTELVKNGPGDSSFSGRAINFLMKPFFSQSAEKGAFPILYAATSPEVVKNGYYGPNGFYEMKGEVTSAFVPVLAKDLTVGKRFWEESEKLTKVKWG